MNRLNGLNRINRLNGPPKGGGISWASYWATRTPSNLRATVASTTQINLTWADAADAAEGINVYASEDYGTTFTLLDNVAFGAEAYNATGLDPTKLYCFYIKANSGTNESLESNIAYETTIPLHLTLEAANLTAITVTNRVAKGDNAQAGNSWDDMYGVATDILSSNFSVSSIMKSENADLSPMVGLRTNLAEGSYNGTFGDATGYSHFAWEYLGVIYRGYNKGNIATTGVSIPLVYILRFRRVTDTIYVDIYYGGSWTSVYTYPNTTTANLYMALAFDDNVSKLHYPQLSIENNKVLLNMIGAVMMFDGNSLMAGQGGTSPSVQLLALHPFDVNLTSLWDNTSVGAQDTLDMIADAAADVDAHFMTGVNNYLFAQEIGNDIFLNGTTVRDAVDNFWDYCDARRVVGFKVFVGTIHARLAVVGGYPGLILSATDIAAANALIRAEYTSHADGLFDLAAQSELSDYTDLTYFNADQIHCTTAGYAVWAREMKQALLKYIADN